MKSHLTVLAPTTLLGIAVAAHCATASWASGISPEINEIRTEQSGPDNDEFVELRGTPGGVVDGLWYIVIGDSESFPPTQNGSVESVTQLTGNFDANGYFVLAKDTFTLGAADQVATLNFEGNDNVTHLLVSNFTGSLNDDLDTNDDGTLDVTPWDAVLDCIALVKNDSPDGNSDEFYYCVDAIGPDGSFVPGHVYRCEDTRALRIGDFSVGVDDSPGAPNADCGNGGGGGGGVAQINEYRIDQPSTDNDEYFELSGEPGTSLDGLWFISIGDGSGGSGVVETAFDLTGNTIGSSGYFVAAEDTFTLGTADAVGNVNFENSDNLTFLLVRDFTGASGDDLDDGDDGEIDEPAPWSEIIDSIAVVESFGSGDLIYSENTIGPDGTFVPAHGYRCFPDGAWTIGEFVVTEGTDTPGADNLPCPVVLCGGDDPRNCFEARAEPGCSDTICCDLVNAVDSSCGDTQWDASCVEIAQTVCLSSAPAPAVSLNEIRMKQAGSDDDEFFELVGPANTSLDGVSLVVIGGFAEDLDGVIETAVNLSGYSTNSSGYFVAAEETFSLGPADALLDLDFTDAYQDHPPRPQLQGHRQR